MVHVTDSLPSVPSRSDQTTSSEEIIKHRSSSLAASLQQDLTTDEAPFAVRDLLLSKHARAAARHQPSGTQESNRIGCR